LHFIHKSSIFPLSAILVLEDTRVYISTTNHGNVAFYVEAVEAIINKSLSRYTTLGILDINLYNSYIRLWEDFDNLWLGYEVNVIKNISGFDN